MSRIYHRKILRLIIQTNKKRQRGTQREDLYRKDLENDEVIEDTYKENSLNDEYVQDNSISFEDTTEDASSQEDALEDWIEHIQSSAREADEKILTNNITNWDETQKKLKWRQVLRIVN